jgi:small redox-active disulfide protein 2
MEIKVLGTGCAGCKLLYANVEEAAKELDLNVKLTKEEDMIKILSYNVMKLPALIIDEVVVASGKKLSISEIKKLIKK